MNKLTMSTPIERILEAEGTEEGDRMIKKIARNSIRTRIHANELLIDRREDYAEIFAVGDIDVAEAFRLIREREDDFVEEYEDSGLPEWLLRAEAQDSLLEAFHQKLKEHGVIEGDK